LLLLNTTCSKLLQVPLDEKIHNLVNFGWRVTATDIDMYLVSSDGQTE